MCWCDSAEYPQWEVQRQKRVVPSDYVPPTAPFEGNSRYKSDFPQHGRTPRQSFKPVENTIRSDAPFDCTTEARKSYVQHALWPPQVKPEQTTGVPKTPAQVRTFFRFMTKLKSEVMWLGVRESRDEGPSYVQHAVPRREVREKPVWEPSTARLEPSTARLDGMSTARKDYGPIEHVLMMNE